MQPPPRPRLALTLGDPAGIGPEVVAATVADAGLVEALDPVVLGPPDLRVGVLERLPRVPREELGSHVGPAWIDVGEGPLGAFEPGRAQAACGRAALDALRAGHELALAGEVDALVTAPVCKEALHLAGEAVEGQTQLLARWAGAEDCQMLAVADAMRVLIATRHMALRAALDALTPELVAARLRLLDAELTRLGLVAGVRPRLALAGLNPHAGEGGLFGDEEQRVLAPALAAVRAEGLDVTGPEPADTVFVRAGRGAFDAVLALYHDQGFIPVKVAAPTTGITILLGMPYLRISPAHGTAFDIAGRGEADPENLARALRVAADLVGRRAARG